MNKNGIKEYDFLNMAKGIVFCMTPTEFDTNPYYYSNLSDKAQKLYSYMISRLNLAKKIGLRDEEGKFYILFPQEDIANLLHVTSRTVSTLTDQLCKVGLIEKRKSGYGNYGRIYVKDIVEEALVSTNRDFCEDEFGTNDSQKTIEQKKSSRVEKKTGSSVYRKKTSPIEAQKPSAHNKEYNNLKKIKSSSEVMDDDKAMHEIMELLGYESAVRDYGENIADAVLREFYAFSTEYGDSLSKSDYQQVCLRISNRGRAINDPRAYVKKCVKNLIQYKKHGKENIPAHNQYKNSFNQFEQRSYDMEELERLLLEN